MEIWDAYDEHFNRIENMSMVRGERIPKGVLHLVCDVLVRHTDGDYLLMQRDPGKHHGGIWEASAGGSALCGETPLACAKRELYEETGIWASDLQQIGQIISIENHTIYVEFLCVTDHDKDGIILQEGETSAFKWVSRDELIRMDRRELITERIQQFVEELKQR